MYRAIAEQVEYADYPHTPSIPTALILAAPGVP
jgi:hypothetical protein